jgi:hypothetical protein
VERASACCRAERSAGFAVLPPMFKVPNSCMILGKSFCLNLSSVMELKHLVWKAYLEIQRVTSVGRPHTVTVIGAIMRSIEGTEHRGKDLRAIQKRGGAPGVMLGSRRAPWQYSEASYCRPLRLHSRCSLQSAGSTSRPGLPSVPPQGLALDTPNWCGTSPHRVSHLCDEGPPVARAVRDFACAPFLRTRPLVLRARTRAARSRARSKRPSPPLSQPGGPARLSIFRRASAPPPFQRPWEGACRGPSA